MPRFIRRSYFHNDVEFEKNLSKQRKAEINGALSSYLKEIASDLGISYKVDKHRQIKLKNDYEFLVYSGLHTYGTLGKDLTLPNDLLNRFSAFVKSNLTELKIKRADFELHQTKEISKDLLGAIVKRDEYANLIAKVKGDPLTLSSGFSIKKDNASILIVLFSSKKGNNLMHLDYNQDNKELEWDILTKASAELESVISTIQNYPKEVN